jgi:hypothetical protein
MIVINLGYPDHNLCSHDRVELPYFVLLETKKIMIMVNLTMP